LNENKFLSGSSFLPLPTPSSSSNRQTLSTIENMPSTITDNDLQQVPHSWMLMPSTSPTYGITRIVYLKENNFNMM